MSVGLPLHIRGNVNGNSGGLCEAHMCTVCKGLVKVPDAIQTWGGRSSAKPPVACHALGGSELPGSLLCGAGSLSPLGSPSPPAGSPVPADPGMGRCQGPFGGLQCDTAQSCLIKSQVWRECLKLRETCPVTRRDCPGGSRSVVPVKSEMPRFSITRDI